MANSNGWGDGSVNNNIGWGQGANNSTGWGKSHLNSWSGATDIDGGNPPVNSVAPALSGTAQEGQTLTCSTGTWSGSPTYTYQWKRDGNNITSATNSTYTLVTADVGTSIKCTVTATNFVGSATADSNTVTPTSSVDADAQAFITAASITDPTQQSAINQLVVDLKGYGVWTKMKALYPFVGGTSTSHSYNLRNTSQFQITWSGGLTHNSQGVTGGGVNGFGNTGLIPSSALTNNSLNVSVYARTDAQLNETQLGCSTSSFLPIIGLSTWNIASQAVFDSYDYLAHRIVSATLPNGKGFYHGNILSSTNQKFYKNGSSIGSVTTAQTQTQPTTQPIYILARNDSGTAANYSARNLAFASIGDGLTDTEAANFYTAVQAFQTTLGRSIGTQTVSDADAQAFVTNAGIVDQVEANAINNLVIGLKADSLWTKMKAVYPFVGGTSTTMKFNLKNPLNTDAAFRLVFNGGLTYSSTGLLGGVNGYADTKLSPSTSLSLNNTHISFYSRTDTSTTENVEMGINDIANNSRLFIAPKFSGNNTAYRAVNSAQAGPGTSPNMQGFFIASRVNSTAMKLYRNASVLFNDSTSSGVLNSSNIFLLCYNSSGIPLYYTDRECAFASIGDGLDDTEATNLYNRVQTFNTALARQV